MKDDVLNQFIKTMLSVDVVIDKFEQYIEIFSKFLSYTNPDYKYNGTYLSQYISDFVQVYEILRKKNEKYQEIFLALIFLNYNYELVADKVFRGRLSYQGDPVLDYIGISKNKILSKGIEVRIKIEVEEDEYIFCKEYDNFEEEKLPERIRDEVKNFIKVKLGRKKK